MIDKSSVPCSDYLYILFNADSGSSNQCLSDTILSQIGAFYVWMPVHYSNKIVIFFAKVPF